ncbi:CidA/LrgA family protein [Paraburkholderia humisilvae]|uniref:Holin-like protein CidA n=1 Tax=Paraburkholderia humisilvae TaxID=627669 RepID=A0A6J5E6X3_9BURK|nr:CidA/LrgA family protein [Paraburkholderia humisilvae]CAB3760875.1 Holin-like protein CidA [Paraburkholderia humisilvae]
MSISVTKLAASARSGAVAPVARALRVVVQCGVLAGVWFVADFAVRRIGLPVPGGVIGLLALLAALLCGGIAPHWVKAGADWLLSELLLFFIPAAVAAVQYGGLLRENGWRLALVVVAGTLMVMVAVAFAVEQTSRFERRLALRRIPVDRQPAR